MNKKHFILLMTILMILTANLPVFAFEIIIDNEVVVKKSRIYLTDIAEVKDIKNLNNLKDIDLGKAPLPGYKKYISRELIKLLIKKRGYASDDYNLSVPSKIAVQRRAKKINSSVIEEFISEKLKEKLKKLSEKYELVIDLKKKMITLPDQEYKLKLLKDKKISPGRSTIPVAIYIEDKEYKRMYIPIYIKTYKKAYVAKRYLSQGTEIRREDFVYKLIEIKNLEEKVITEKETNIFDKNKRLSYSLSAGEVLKKNNYHSSYLINWGDRIQAKVIVGDVELKLMVIARERGRQDEYIKVENPESKVNFQAKVISSQLVQVIKE